MTIADVRNESKGHGREKGHGWLRAADFARALGGIHPSANQWLAPCPVPGHGKGKGDRNPSLSLGDGPRRGQVLVHCFAGCSNNDVIAALKARGPLVR